MKATFFSLFSLATAAFAAPIVPLTEVTDLVNAPSVASDVLSPVTGALSAVPVAGGLVSTVEGASGMLGMRSTVTVSSVKNEVTTLTTTVKGHTQIISMSLQHLGH